MTSTRWAHCAPRAGHPAPTLPAAVARACAGAALAAALTGCAGVVARPADAAGDPAAEARAESKATAAATARGTSPQRSRRPAAPTARPAPPAEPAEALPKVDLSSQILFQLLASEIAAQRGQTGSAAATYLSLARQTRDPRLARRATELALVERSIERATEAAVLWRQLSPESTLAAQTLETLWLSTGQFPQVEPLLAERLAGARREGTLAEFYGLLQRNLLRTADKAAALALFDRLAVADQAVPEARLAAAALAGAAGLQPRAAAEARAALAARPDDETAAVAAARHLSSGGAAGIADALALLDAFLKRNPKAVEARFTYARMLAGDGKADAAQKQMELALREEPDSPPILFSLAQIAYQTRQLPVAEDYLQRFLALPEDIQRDNAPAYLFLAQIAEDRGRLDDAIGWLSRVTRGEQMLPAVIRRALLLGKSGRLDEGRELLRSTSVPTSRERLQLTSAEAQLLREAGRHADAFEVLDKALERTPNSPELLYDHGMAAEKIDRLGVMEASLRKLIALRPDHAHAYNALGYTFADRNIRLDEALTLLKKAVELAPDDAHILDSMGWLLYRRGDLEQAVQYLQRAYALRPEAEIAAHLGEVLWKLGRTEEARTLWRTAASREPDNETLRATLARLNIAL